VTESSFDALLLFLYLRRQGTFLSVTYVGCQLLEVAQAWEAFVLGIS
jgi:hypothetical protein